MFRKLLAALAVLLIAAPAWAAPPHVGGPAPVAAPAVTQPPVMVGAVAGGVIVPRDLSASGGPYTQANTVSIHTVYADVACIRVGWAQWSVNGPSGEVAPTGDATRRFSVEEPLGSGLYTRGTFGGSTTGTDASGTTLVSDPTCPAGGFHKGDRIGVWAYVNSPTGLAFINTHAALPGERVEYGSGSLTDKSAGGAVIATGTGSNVLPVLIVGNTRDPSICIVSNSRGVGVQDGGDNTGDLGDEARSIGVRLGYINLSVGNDTLHEMTGTTFSRRLAIAQTYCTDIIAPDAINDVGASYSAASIEADYATFLARFTGKRSWFVTTMASPSATSDGLTTPGNDDGGQQRRRAHGRERLGPHEHCGRRVRRLL